MFIDAHLFLQVNLELHEQMQNTTTYMSFSTYMVVTRTPLAEMQPQPLHWEEFTAMARLPEDLISCASLPKHAMLPT